MVLIIGKPTREDSDWIPLEIEYAVDVCEIPLIAAYPDYKRITAPAELSRLWPYALAERIDDASAHVIHVPFSREPLRDAISQFGHNKYPIGGGLGIYDDEAYRTWGLL